jgi:bifunctional non-homologous end joining protein LigD
MKGLQMRKRNAVTSIRGRKQENTRRKKSTERVIGGETAADGVRITHPERIVYPGTKISKQDVFEYYRAVMRWLLPELVQRPLSILRCPQGAGAVCFFQKHPADRLGGAVASLALREKDGGTNRYFYVNDARGVLELVQMNAIEFHPWGSRVDDPDKPDRLVFDLDPAPGIGWTQLVAAARDVRAQLRKVGLESFPRLSGGKGLHVVVPIRRGPSWDQAKAFCETLAGAMAETKPALYLATASKAKREGRIFIDWLRNTRGATSVASWSLRARQGAPVAMPLRWEELAKLKSAGAFDLAAAMKRARTLRNDPWQDFANSRQSLPSPRRDDESVRRLRRS